MTEGEEAAQAAQEGRKVRATWADFGLEALDFAREQPLLFGILFCALLAFTALILWVLFPRATKALEAVYSEKIEEHRRKKKPDEPELPFGGSDA